MKTLTKLVIDTNQNQIIKTQETTRQIEPN